MDASTPPPSDAPPSARSETRVADPAAEQSFATDDPRPRPSWADARDRLETAETYWLATVRPDGRPHVVPVLAIWLDGALYTTAGAATRKARNLAANPRCVVTAEGRPLHLVVEGVAAKVGVGEDPTLHRVAEAFAARHRWEVEVREGAFFADGAPTAGPPPYEVYRIVPELVFAFGTDETLGAARWRFA